MASKRAPVRGVEELSTDELAKELGGGGADDLSGTSTEDLAKELGHDVSPSPETEPGPWVREYSMPTPSPDEELQARRAAGKAKGLQDLQAARPGFWAKVGGAIKGLARAPVEAVTNPRAAGEAAGIGVGNAMTSGGLDRQGYEDMVDLSHMRQRAAAGTFSDEDAKRLADRISGRMRQPYPVHMAKANAGQLLDDEMGRIRESEGLRDQAPATEAVAGLAAPTPGKMIGGAMMRGIPAAGGLQRLFRAGGAGATAAATDAAGQGMMQDGPGGAASSAAAAAPEGLAAGLVTQAGVEGGRALAAGASKGVGAVFPWVKRFGTARDAGLIPHAEQLPRGRVGVQASGEEAVDKIRAHQQERQRRVGGELDAARAQHGGKMADLQPFADKTNALRESLRLDAGDVAPGMDDIDAAARKVQNRVYAERGRTNSDLIKTRAGVRRQGAPGDPFPSPLQEGYRTISSALGDTLPPELEAADSRYADTKRMQEGENLTMYDKPEPRTYQPPGGGPRQLLPHDKTVAGERLARIHDTTEPAKRLQSHIEALAESDPVMKRAIDAIVAKKALEQTRFGAGRGEQVDLPHATAPVQSFVKKNLGAIARRVDDRALRPGSRAQGAAAVPFFSRMSSRRRQDAEEAPTPTGDEIDPEEARKALRAAGIR